VSDHLPTDLRRVMREHDGEAPTATDLLDALGDAPRRERVPAWSRGRRRLVPLAAGAAVAVVIAGSLWAGAQLTGAGSVTSQRHHATGSPLACPARYAHTAPWVPAEAKGVEARSRLVPRRTPSSALVCAYDGSNIGPSAGWKLSGRRVLSGGLSGLAADLTWEPRKVPGQDIACTLVGGKQVNYLIGLTYPGGGRLWVAATLDPNACVTSSNGTFISFGFIGGLVTQAFNSGRWPAQPPKPCRTPGGRLGQDQAMVPPGAISVSICGGHGGPTLTSGFSGLVSALNALPARPGNGQCSMIPHHRGRFYSLLFGYPQGPGVQVTVNSGCRPAINNRNLQAVSAATILPIIVRLLR
jgi:hypothetical protein